MLKVLGKLLLLLLPVCQMVAAPGPDTAQLVRTLGVTDGLPQSFISGLVQDDRGFIWIGTRDGLARYDGRKFRIFNHVPDDTTTLSGNIISNLYYDRKGRLWIMYESGELDLLNTATEKLEHLSSQSAYQAANNSLKGNITAAKSLAEDDEGNIWLPGRQGIFIFNIEKHSLRFYNNKMLGLTGKLVYGLAKYGKEILLVTDTAFVIINSQCHITSVRPYRFPKPCLHSLLGAKDVYPVIRKNGEIVMLDEERLIIYQPASGTFTIKALPRENIYVYTSILPDEKGNIFFDYNGAIYYLSPQNVLQLWRKRTVHAGQSQCMLLDRSGMLWIGGNGSGIRLYDKRLTHLQGQTYSDDFNKFIQDVLIRDQGVNSLQMKRCFINGLSNYQVRWAKAEDNTLWIAAGNEDPFTGHTCTLANGQLQQQTWKIAGAPEDRTALQNINALSFSRSGRLWGVDNSLRTVLFDPATYTATVYPAPSNTVQGVNSIVIDGENVFWISSSSQGLFRYDRATGELQQHVPNEQGEGFPSYSPSILLQDANDSGKLWIGTLSTGLLHFDKRTGQSEVYTIANGLPNNTVYAILPDPRGRLWCSTNKGIFRFDPKTGAIYSFTSKDGLPGDEFNRFHFLSLPNERMAFGGVDGYIVFNPLAVSEDNFNPDVAITDIAINNAPVDFGCPGSPLRQSINSLASIELPYQSNFLTFEFAALEYNVPEKLQYRYMLEGINQHWVNAGYNNTAVYTNLSPGTYTLSVNATNTAGKWGSNIKRLYIIIHPPFWQTWWFMLLCGLAGAGLVYGVITSRLTAIRNKEKQQLQFERKAMELEAQALRAQMNPHFIFNCLNSIKCLIREDKNQEAVVYLTTFSKLIRTQLSNAQKEVSLYDELETCKLYIRLEALRFGDKVTSTFTIADDVDVHSVMVPPLIIQPFIENAIWHGILPLDKGGTVNICISQKAGIVKCIIDDNGIGRQTSQLNKPKMIATHQSRGMQLIKDRLDLHSQIHNRGGWLEIIDKHDSQGNAAGTSAIIYLKTEI